MAMEAERLKQNANLSEEIKTQASTENWKAFSQERLSVCEMEITTLSFFPLFVRVFWPETISKNELTWSMLHRFICVNL